MFGCLLRTSTSGAGDRVPSQTPAQLGASAPLSHRILPRPSQGKSIPWQQAARAPVRYHRTSRVGPSRTGPRVPDNSMTIKASRTLAHALALLGLLFPAASLFAADMDVLI